MSSYEPLSTHRLRLRKLTQNDLHAVFALRSDDTVCRYIDRPVAQHSSEARVFIERIEEGYAGGTAYYWAISLKGNPGLIGTICLWNFSAGNTVAEVGYEMLPEHNGNGYMQEALGAICAYSFSKLMLTAIEASTHRDNLSSIKLLQKNSFTLCEGKADPDATENVIYIKSSPAK